MPRKLALLSVVTLLLALAFPQPRLQCADSVVKMWEEDVVIPTYPIGDPDPDPMFFSGRTYQGAQGAVYPYPLMEKISSVSENRTHRLVYLENEYIKLGLFPGGAGGGRIFSAVDKTNGYEIFYHQHVIKPGLIGVLGAWISGGVEWNVPHHHRTSTYMPVDYTLKENPDGSKTVWMGEIETRHRMKWMVGATLKPGSSVIQVECRLANRTPLVQSFLYWANVAVHVDSSYQVLFPPQQEWVTGHGKHAFSTYPLASGPRVVTTDGYSKGIDLSWWKAHPSPISLFAIHSREDFFGGYDHGQHAGVAHIANHHSVPGKKMWNWGPGETARMWDHVLTDKDGPYIELMVGAYQDNQPDYSWLQPYEVKSFKFNWFPLREIGGMKNANLNAAVNLEVTANNRARFGFNTTAEYRGAGVRLTAGEKVLFEQVLDISPARPFVKEVALPDGVSEMDVKAALFDARGEELVSYRKQPPRGEPAPEPVTPPRPPEEIKTVEELYLTGLRLEQFHSAALAAEPYYEAALKMDPGNCQVNTALGLLYLRNLKFAEAADKFHRALRRATASHTRPRDGEAQYYLGVACKYLGLTDQAYDSFYAATWSEAWSAAAYYELAEISTSRGDYVTALEELGRSLSFNANSPKSANLKAALLRKLGDLTQSAKTAGEVLERDPLDHWAAYELYLAAKGNGSAAAAADRLAGFEKIMHGTIQNYLELALDYGSCGLYQEGTEILDRLTILPEPAPSPVTLSGHSLTDGSRAMAYYYLGWFAGKMGDKAKAEGFYSQAGRMPTDLVFPFRAEARLALESALTLNPQDARACYYLGELLFDSQPEKALTFWEKSRELDGSLALVHRNLALAYSLVRKDIPAATASLEKAIQYNSSDPRFFLELDHLYELGSATADKRLALLEQHQAVVSWDDNVLMRQTGLYNQVGNYDKALELLDNHHFHIWEGRGEIHDNYAEAHLARGERYLKERKYTEALADFEAALQYPLNLEVGRPRDGGTDPEAYYFIGLAREAQGDKKKARENFQKTASAEINEYSELSYFQGLALQKLGQKQQAGELFGKMVESGRKALERGHGEAFFAKFGDQESENVRLAQVHYTIGLGYLGLANRDKAGEEFRKAVELDANQYKAARRLAEI